MVLFESIYQALCANVDVNVSKMTEDERTVLYGQRLLYSTVRPEIIDG